jgi:hypothetical protein
MEIIHQVATETAVPGELRGRLSGCGQARLRLDAQDIQN